jgi:GNAT superfamily N-acetyltransferase
VLERSREDGYLVTTDPHQVDLDLVWEFLRESYWSPGITRAAVERGVLNSIPFSLLDPHGAQAGFARVVTDRARFAWLADVFVLDRHRGRGLGVFLIETVVTHPELARLRMLLATDDAHGLYERFGFGPVDVSKMMERRAWPAPDGDNAPPTKETRWT